MTVKWLTPDKQMFGESNVDMSYNKPNLRTWHFPNPHKSRPTGDWTFELYLDGKHLVTKKFTVTDMIADSPPPKEELSE